MLDRLIASAPAIGDKLKTAGGSAGFAVEGDKADITVIAGRMIQVVLVLMGSLFLAQIVYGGYTWMTARGDEKQVEKAQNIIQRNVIGFTIMLASYAIATYVVNRLAQATLAT